MKGKSSQPAYQNIDLSNIDPDLYLDGRDAPEIEALWQQAEAEIAAEKAKLPAKTLKSLQRDDQEYREEVFKWVLRVTGHSELAACISDDLGLLQEAYWNAVTDSLYINGLLRAYSAGRLPTREDWEA